MKLGFVTPLMKSFLVSLHIFLSPPLNIQTQPSFIQKSHILCDQSIVNKEIFLKMSSEASHYFPSIGMKVVRYVELPTLYELDMYTNEKKSSKPQSLYHKLRYENMNMNIPYDRFCELEEQLSFIVRMYVGDERSTWFMATHPIFMYSDGLPHYLLKSENVKILYISKSVEIGYTQMVLWTDQHSSDM